MKTKKNIIIRTHFPAVHHWSECDLPQVEFLKHPHRHVFHVTMKREVEHDNRDIEFISWKAEIDDFIADNFWGADLGNASCEMIADDLMEKFDADYVSVFEDNENGAEVYRV